MYKKHDARAKLPFQTYCFFAVLVALAVIVAFKLPTAYKESGFFL